MALLVVNCLAEHGDRGLLYLYRFIEKAGIGVAAHFLSSHYGLFSLLKGREAGTDLFFHQLCRLTGTPGVEVEVVDLFLQLYGRHKKVRFYDRWLDTATLSHEIQRLVKPGKLCLLYNLCCYGDPILRICWRQDSKLPSAHGKLMPALLWNIHFSTATGQVRDYSPIKVWQSAKQSAVPIEGCHAGSRTGWQAAISAMWTAKK
ncbi:MAG: hypothetical protein SVV67_07105 [Bacillota bacterium]|nr:hypothetical protein [Bacillota bacterium]